jgi:hypothetical protein
MKYIIIALTLLLISISLHAHVTPSGGSRETALRQGDRVLITWDSSIVSSPVTLSLWDGDRRMVIPIHSAFTTNRASYDWVIPDTLSAGLQYRFVVASASRPIVRHFSESYVAIEAQRPRVSDVAENTQDIPLRVFPLPATDLLRVEWGQTEAQQLVLTTLIGASLSTWTCPNNATRVEVNVASLPPGMYILMVRYANGATRSQPVVIQR